MAVVYALAQGLAQRSGLQIAVACASYNARQSDRPVIETDGPVTLYRLPIPPDLASTGIIDFGGDCLRLPKTFSPI